MNLLGHKNLLGNRSSKGSYALDTEWSYYTGIVSGLPDVGSYSSITLFVKDSDFYAIMGSFNTGMYGFKWTGSTWATDSSIINGWSGSNTLYKPCVHEWGGNLVMYVGQSDGGVNGWYWYNNYMWKGFTTYGISNASGYASPTLFTIGSDTYCVMGDQDGVYSGYKWNGSNWSAYSSIISGLPHTGFRSTSAYLLIDEIPCLMLGSYGNYIFWGYKWTGSTWVYDESIAAGIGSVYKDLVPSVCVYGSYRYLLTGHYAGGVYGFRNTNIL